MRSADKHSLCSKSPLYLKGRRDFGNVKFYLFSIDPHASRAPNMHQAGTEASREFHPSITADSPTLNTCPNFPNNKPSPPSPGPLSCLSYPSLVPSLQPPPSTRLTHHTRKNKPTRRLFHFLVSSVWAVAIEHAGRRWQRGVVAQLFPSHRSLATLSGGGSFHISSTLIWIVIRPLWMAEEFAYVP